MFTNRAPVCTSVRVIVLSPEPARARETPPIAAATKPATIAVMSTRPRLRLSVFIGTTSSIVDPAKLPTQRRRIIAPSPDLAIARSVEISAGCDQPIGR
jgi:hypothetical protein